MSYTGYSKPMKRSIPDHKWWRCYRKMLADTGRVVPYSYRRYFDEKGEKQITWFTYKGFIYMRDLHITYNGDRIVYYRIDPLYLAGGWG